MKSLKTFITGLVFLLWASVVHAIPTLTFDGSVSFDAGTGILSVNSELTSASPGLPVTQLTGSSLTFSASLIAGSVSPYTDFFGRTGTTSQFSGVTGDDLTIKDGDIANTLLLTGDFVDLTMSGLNGQSTGRLSGNLVSTGGPLQSSFGSSHLLAVEFILTPNFGFDVDMFDSNFAGDIDGDLTGTAQVPEPSIIAVLGLGLAIIGLTRLRHTRI